MERRNLMKEKNQSTDRPARVRRIFPAPWAIRDGGDDLFITDATGRDVMKISYNRWYNRSTAPTREEAMALAEWIVRMPAIVRSATGLARVMREMT